MQWTLLGKLVVLMARRATLAEKTRAHVAGQRAALVEAWCYGALAQLSRQIAAETGHARSREDTRALAHLHVLQTCLILIARLMRRIYEDSAARTTRWASLCGLTPAPMFARVEVARPVPPFIDTG